MVIETGMCTSVGADLSGTAPMYRPFGSCYDVRIS